jgi:hypothetical protein
MPLFFDSKSESPPICYGDDGGWCGPFYVVRLQENGALLVACESCGACWTDRSLADGARSLHVLDDLAGADVLALDAWEYAVWEDLDRVGWTRGDFHYATFADEMRRARKRHEAGRE